jgi:hypothetical protein
MSMNGVPRMMVINIFYNDKECFKRNAVVENRGFGFSCNMQF